LTKSPYFRIIYVMPNRSRKRKRTDFSQLAKTIVDEATGQKLAEKPDQIANSGKNPAAVALGRLGGLKGGKARWKGTTKKQRSEAGRKAALARWRKTKHSKGVNSRVR
jgi:hypothetical protein